MCVCVCSVNVCVVCVRVRVCVPFVSVCMLLRWMVSECNCVSVRAQVCGYLRWCTDRIMEELLVAHYRIKPRHKLQMELKTKQSEGSYNRSWTVSKKRTNGGGPALTGSLKTRWLDSPATNSKKNNTACITTIPGVVRINRFISIFRVIKKITAMLLQLKRWTRITGYIVSAALYAARDSRTHANRFARQTGVCSLVSSVSLNLSYMFYLFPLWSHISYTRIEKIVGAYDTPESIMTALTMLCVWCVVSVRVSVGGWVRVGVCESMCMHHC